MDRLVRIVSVLGLVATATPLLAQQRTLPPAVRNYVSVDAPVVALTHVRLVDGTGTPAKDDQTLIIRGEKVEAVGRTGSLAVPAGAQVLDLTGKTVIPGIIGLHDHMYYSGMRFMGTSYP